MFEMSQLIPDSEYHNAFRRSSSACAPTPDQDSDQLTVTEDPGSCCPSRICGNNSVFAFLLKMSTGGLVSAVFLPL